MKIDKITIECILGKEAKKSSMDALQRYYDDFTRNEDINLVPRELSMPRETWSEASDGESDSNRCIVTIRYNNPIELVPHLVDRELRVLQNIGGLYKDGSVMLWPNDVEFLKPLRYSENSQKSIDRYDNRAAHFILVNGSFEEILLQASIPGILHPISKFRIWREFNSVSIPERVPSGWQTNHKGGAHGTDFPTMMATKYIDGSLDFNERSILDLYKLTIQEVVKNDALQVGQPDYLQTLKSVFDSSIEQPTKYAPRFRIIAKTHVKISDNAAITMMGIYDPKISEN